jgi:4-carboxymuconolactone decarboxylase
MTANASLPDNVRQIAILVVGARFDAAYEILKPNDLVPDVSMAFDFTYALVRCGTLPEPLYRLAVKTFGQHGTNELIYLVGPLSRIDDPQCLQRASA